MCIPVVDSAFSLLIFCLIADKIYEVPSVAKSKSLTPPNGESWSFEERFPPPPIFPPPPPSWKGDANALLRESMWAKMVDQIKRAIKVCPLALEFNN